MQKWLAIIVGTIIVVGLAGIAYNSIFKSSTPATPTNTVTLPSAGATSAQPDAFAIAFYTWYLANKHQNMDFPYTGDLNSILGAWLTPDFLEHWDELLSAFEVDPVLLTKDDPTSWGTNIAAQTLSQSSTGASVHVSLDSSSPHAHAYTITLVRNPANDSWKISRVDYEAP